MCQVCWNSGCLRPQQATYNHFCDACHCEVTTTKDECELHCLSRKHVQMLEVVHLLEQKLGNFDNEVQHLSQFCAVHSSLLRLGLAMIGHCHSLSWFQNAPLHATIRTLHCIALGMPGNPRNDSLNFNNQNWNGQP